MTATQPKTDVLIVGATGFTGRLILRYLARHPSRTAPKIGYTLAIAGRSLSRLSQIANTCGINPDDRAVAGGGRFLRQIEDITDPVQVRKLVSDVRVVVSAVGPFWRYGKALVGACAELGVHYVDITGESHFIKYCIDHFDYQAFKTHAIIINSAGLDSVPSDLSAYLSVGTIKSTFGKDAQSGKSTSAFAFTGCLPSGGSLSTILDIVGGAVPKDVIRRVREDPYILSPVKGAPTDGYRLVGHVPLTDIVGGIYLMASGDEPVVRRTWGLFERSALIDSSSHGQDAYGPQFEYSEFQASSSWLAALVQSLLLVLASALMMFVPPMRFLARHLLPKPGEGPSDEQMQNGSVEVTNVTMVTSSSSDRHPRAVKTVIRGDGDGYLLSAVMASEIALALLPSQHGRLTHMAKEGGVLTPVAALGAVLKERLESTRLFEFESGMIDVDSPTDRKTR